MATRSPAFKSSSNVQRKPGVRELAAQATRDSLLRAATKVFAKHGLSGGSVEKISKAAKSYDRLIYYYFGNKEGLFVAVLEETYRRFNEAEAALKLDDERPVESLLDVTRFVMTYYRKNPEFVTLLNSENLHRGKHINKSRSAGEYSSPAIAVVDKVLRSGVEKGLFRSGIRARDLYLLIASTGYFYQSNRFTLSAFLGEDLEDPNAIAHWEAFVERTVLLTVMLRPEDVPPG
ncbi:MAG: TetR/AcrR family transcriptional regulator [Ideonella sp.]